MNIEEILSEVSDRGLSGRDLLVDHLGDALEAPSVDDAAARGVILELINLAGTEQDKAVHESILNLLSRHYDPLGNCGTEIEAFVEATMATFAIGSMMHALAIVAESRLDSRIRILNQYADSDIAVLRQTAYDYLVHG